jgi:hypothetical protein
MLYGIGAIGAGMRRRRKEIRNERAAIREEFERWRQNNPYATAADFHAKVKQLGSSTPGGSVALPDGMAIQRMAQENGLRKQEEEAEKERLRRVNALNLQTAEAKALENFFAGKPDADIQSALTTIGAPVNAPYVAMAEAAKAREAQTRADRDRQNALSMASTLTSLRNQAREERGGAFADPAQVEQRTRELAAMYGLPMPSQSAPAPAMTASTASAASSAPSATAQPTASSSPNLQGLRGALEPFIDKLVAESGDKYFGPNGLAALEQDAVGLVAAQGANRSEEDVIAALQQTNAYRQYAEAYDNNWFQRSITAGRPAPDLAITVGDKNKTTIPLAEVITSPLNNQGLMSDLHIPPDRIDVFEQLVAPFFEFDPETGATVKPGVGQAELSGLEQSLAEAGIYRTSALAQVRAERLAEESQHDSIESYLTDQRSTLNDRVSEVVTAMGQMGTDEAIASGQAAIAAFAAERDLIMRNRTADIYANGGVHAFDLLPVTLHGDYNPQQVVAIYNEQIADLQKAVQGLQSPSTVLTPEDEAEASRLDKATEFAAKPINDDDVQAVFNALDPRAAAPLSLGTDQAGNLQVTSGGGKVGPLMDMLQSDNKEQREGVARAIAASFDTFNSYRTLPVSGGATLRPNREGVGAVVMDFLNTVVTRDIQQSLAPFPQYNQALREAKAQFAVSLSLVPGLSQDEINELTENFSGLLNAASIGQGVRDFSLSNPMAGVQAVDDTGTPVINF